METGTRGMLTVTDGARVTNDNTRDERDSRSGNNNMATFGNSVFGGSEILVLTECAKVKS